MNPTPSPSEGEPTDPSDAELTAAATALLAQFDSYLTESKLSHAEAHSYLVQHDLWAALRAALTLAARRAVERTGEGRGDAIRSEDELMSVLRSVPHPPTPPSAEGLREALAAVDREVAYADEDRTPDMAPIGSCALSVGNLRAIQRALAALAIGVESPEKAA